MLVSLRACEWRALSDGVCMSLADRVEDVCDCVILVLLSSRACERRAVLDGVCMGLAGRAEEEVRDCVF